MKNQQQVSYIILLLAAIIWGFAFVAQRSGMEHIGPLLFNAIRFFMGGLLLIPFYLYSKQSNKEIKTNKISPLFLWPGIILFLASFLQQKGMVYTSAGNAGFITGIYMLMVPVFGMFLGHKIPSIIWIAVPVSLAGLFFVSFNENMIFSEGDLWVFSSSVFWAMHVLVINWLVKNHDAILLALSQFLICGAISMFLAFIFEPVVLSDIKSAGIPLLYSGIMSVGLAFTLQVIGQKHAHPAIASVLLSSEALFAVLGGWLILSETMTIRQTGGCILILSGIILINVFHKSSKKPVTIL